MSTPKKEQEFVNKKMTPEMLRKHEGFEHYNDDEAEHIIDSVEYLAEMFYDLWEQTEKK